MGGVFLKINIMDIETELRILKEIDSIMPPFFSLLPDVTYLDKDHKEVLAFRDEVFVRFNDSKQNEYLKKVLKYNKKEDSFEIKEAREYLYNLSQKAII